MLVPHAVSIYTFLLSCLDLGLLGSVVQVSTEQLDALDVVALVELLVDGVSAVGRAAHGEEQDVLASSLLKGEGNGNAENTLDMDFILKGINVQ